MRLVLLVPPLISEFESKVMAPVFVEEGIEVVGAVIDARPPRSGRQRVMEELKRGRGGYALVMTAQKLLSRRPAAPPERAEAYFKQRGVPILATPKLYSPETIAWIRGKAPDVMYRSGFGIIREPILSIAPKGVLSYHHGNIRKYRGQPVAFWELYHGEQEMGVTVQALNAGLDSGKIVTEISVPIQPDDSWSALYARAYACSDRLLVDACRLLREEGFAPLELSENEIGRLYTSPNLRKWLMLQLKVAGRKLRRLLKRLLRI